LFLPGYAVRKSGTDHIFFAIILEPEGRNAAPAIALAALHAVQGDRDPLLVLLPADHLIDHQQAFHAGIQNVQILAEQDRLVTFGIVPDKPAKRPWKMALRTCTLSGWTRKPF
jgi:mannose-1-phosphate guanylyltransferase